MKTLIYIDMTLVHGTDRVHILCPDSTKHTQWEPDPVLGCTKDIGREIIKEHPSTMGEGHGGHVLFKFVLDSSKSINKYLGVKGREFTVSNFAGTFCLRHKARVRGPKPSDSHHHDTFIKKIPGFGLTTEITRVS